MGMKFSVNLDNKPLRSAVQHYTAQCTVYSKAKQGRSCTDFFPQ